jgi:hypothetical protein
VPISRIASSAWKRLRRWIARWNRPCAVSWLVIFDAAGASATTRYLAMIGARRGPVSRPSRYLTFLSLPRSSPRAAREGGLIVDAVAGCRIERDRARHALVLRRVADCLRQNAPIDHEVAAAVDRGDILQVSDQHARRVVVQVGKRHRRRAELVRVRLPPREHTWQRLDNGVPRLGQIDEWAATV